MRKLPIIAVVAAVIGLSSCKGDFDCTCTYEWIAGSDTTIVLTYQGVSKADADAGCTTNETQLQTIDPNASCDLSKK